MKAWNKAFIKQLEASLEQELFNILLIAVMR